MELVSQIRPTTLRDYLQILFRQKRIISVSVLAVLVTVFFALGLKTPLYEAQVKMLIAAEKHPQSPYFRELLQFRQAQITLTQSEIVKSNAVLERVVSALHLYERPEDYEKQFYPAIKERLVGVKDSMRTRMQASFDRAARSFSEFILNRSRGGIGQLWVDWKTRPAMPLVDDHARRFREAVESLKSRTKVEPIANTDTFTIRVRDFSPAAAAAIANAISRSYVIFDLEQQLAELQLKYGDKHAFVLQLQDNIDRITATLGGQAVSNMEAIGPASVKIIEQASVPLYPAGLHKAKILAAALLIGLLLGPMLAFLFNALDQTLKSPDEARDYLGLPVLGFLPRKHAAHRDLWRQIFYDHFYLTLKQKGMKTVMVAPLDAPEESASATADLGQYLAEKLGHKVLLIDADLEKACLSKVLRMQKNTGLAEVLEGKASWEQAVKELNPHLALLPSGRTERHDVSLLEGPRMAEILNSARARYEIVLLNTAGLNHSQEALLLATHVDGTVFMVDEGHTRRQSAKTAIEAFDHQSPALGVIVNNRSFPIPNVLYERL